MTQSVVFLVGSFKEVYLMVTRAMNIVLKYYTPPRIIDNSFPKGTLEVSDGWIARNGRLVSCSTSELKKFSLLVITKNGYSGCP